MTFCFFHCLTIRSCLFLQLLSFFLILDPFFLTYILHLRGGHFLIEFPSVAFHDVLLLLLPIEEAKRHEKTETVQNPYVAGVLSKRKSTVSPFAQRTGPPKCSPELNNKRGVQSSFVPTGSHSLSQLSSWPPCLHAQEHFATPSLSNLAHRTLLALTNTRG